MSAAPPPGTTLHRLVSEQAYRTPDAVAIVDDLGPTTYAQLERRSDRIASRLIRGGLRPEGRVALLAPKSADAVAAILGVLKSGGVYVPLDPAAPLGRLARIARSSAVSHLVAHPRRAALADAVLSAALGHGRGPEALIVSDPAEDPVLDDGPAPPRPRDVPGALAYILFTSGSTGEPKGVPITHASVLHFVAWARRHFGLGPHDRLSGHSPLHFDLSVWDVFGALTCGAELHLVPERANLLPEATARFIREARLTQWFSVPSVLVSMAARDVLADRDLPELRRVIWCGDVLPVSALRYWMPRLPRARFTNLYGPTEATIASSHHTVRVVPAEHDAPVPIGTAIDGEQLAVLGPGGSPLPAGTVGDLYIAGAGLSPGYWRAPELTAAAFHEAPPGSGRRWYRTGDLARIDAAGVAHFHGRRDRQVKSRGYRIELDEIAAEVGRLPGVAEGAVVAIETTGFEAKQICAVYTARPDARPDPTVLRAELATRLPVYMLPTRWLELPRLPRNANGKTDHRALEQLLLADGAQAVRAAVADGGAAVR